MIQEPKQDYLEFAGGLDQVTPAWKANPGSFRIAQNYEIDVNGGYVDITGYERFSGQPAPSDAQYAILEVEITGSFEVGDEITGADSSATATVADVVTGDTDYLVITKITGNFQAEVLNVSASPEGNALGAQSVGAASTQKLNAQYLNAAADIYRDDIDPPTGSGSILGGFTLNDVVYCFRNNAGATAADMWESTASGWSQVALGFELEFTSGGTYEILVGDTITGATSTETAVITGVALESGSWAGGDAAGRLIYASQSGAFQAENLNVGANSNVATIAADGSAITLLPSGRFEVVKSNFGGQLGTFRAYGCDTVNRGWEFNGTAFIPIVTGMAVDAPTHVAVHKKHLFFSFGSSAQHSGIGTPYSWSPIFGAAELATGDTITGFKQEPGSEGGATLIIYNRNRINALYGNDSSDWNLVPYREEVGASAYSVQQIGITLFLDDRGITNFRTAQEFGNFSHSTISTLIQPFINEKRSLISASCVSRNKNQYRLFFSDGSGLYVTLNGKKLMGITLIQFPDEVTCTWSDELSDGSEAIFFGSDDGHVYQMEKGTSFDGDSIDAYFYLHYHYSKMLRRNKRYIDVAIEASGTGYAEYSLGYELDYNGIDKSQGTAQNNVLSFAAAYWDIGNWDTGTWDGQTLRPAFHKLTGSAENIALVILKSSDYMKPIRFSGAMFRIIPRRLLR